MHTNTSRCILKQISSTCRSIMSKINMCNVYTIKSKKEMCFDLVHLELPVLPKSANTWFMAQYRITDDQSFPTCLHCAEANKSTCHFIGNFQGVIFWIFTLNVQYFLIPKWLEYRGNVLWVTSKVTSIDGENYWRLGNVEVGKKLKCWLLALQQYPIVSAFAPEKCVTFLCWPAVLQVRRSQHH